MKVEANTLDIETERWDDPGDYPNGVAAGPLPSYSYRILIGTVVLHLDPLEVEAYIDDPNEFVLNLDDELIELPARFRKVRYDSRLEGNRLTLTPNGDTEAEVIERDDYED